MVLRAKTSVHERRGPIGPFADRHCGDAPSAYIKTIRPGSMKSSIVDLLIWKSGGIKQKQGTSGLDQQASCHWRAYSSGKLDGKSKGKSGKNFT